MAVTLYSKLFEIIDQMVFLDVLQVKGGSKMKRPDFRGIFPYPLLKTHPGYAKIRCQIMFILQ